MPIIDQLQTEVLGTVNVRDYGAKGDGVTDDTATIQAALDAAALGATGTFASPNINHSAVVWFPSSNSNYLVKGSLHIRNQGILIRGSGIYGTAIAFEPDASAWVDPDGQSVCFNLQTSVGFLGATWSASGTATATGSSTVLTDSTATFTDGADEITVGCIVLNETTGAWGEVTAVTNTTLTHTALTGGSSTQWTSGDNFRAGGQPTHRRTQIEDLRIQTSDTTTDKLAIRLFDCGQVQFSNLHIDDFWGVNSTGMRLFGREYIHINNCRFDATIPFRISRIKDASLNGANSCDYLHIESAEFDQLSGGTPSGGTPPAAMLIDGDCQLIRCNMRNINFRGGDYAVYWNNPAAQTDQGQSHTVRFENATWEQTNVTPVAQFWFNFESSGLQGLHIDQSVLSVRDDTDTNDCDGVYLKNVHDVSLSNCAVRDVNGGATINAISGVKSLQWYGMNSTTGNTYTIAAGALDKVYAYYKDTQTLPHSALYIQNWIQNTAGVDQANPMTFYEIESYHNHRQFTNNGSTGPTEFRLPAAQAEPNTLEFTFVMLNENNHWLYLLPDGTDHIADATDGQRVILQSAGASVTVKSFRAGWWTILAQSGVVVYE